VAVAQHTVPCMAIAHPVGQSTLGTLHALVLVPYYDRNSLHVGVHLWGPGHAGWSAGSATQCSVDGRVSARADVCVVDEV
jgi:hypothetical protein